MSISNLEILLIKGYRKISYPFYSVLDSFDINFFKCRYEPSCSHYAEEAIKKYGAVKGSVMSFKRVLRCRPGNGGYDPVK